MIKDFNELTRLCREELVFREYREKYISLLETHWNDCAVWLKQNDIQEFSKEAGFQYCDFKFGGHILTTIHQDKHKLIGLRAIRILISYQEDETIEFRTPSVEKSFCGDNGIICQNFLLFMQTTKHLSPRTIETKTYYLWRFSSYLNDNECSLNALTTDIIQDFFKKGEMSLASIHNCSSVIRQLLVYAADMGITEIDMSVYIPKDNYVRNRKLPTTYTEEEIKKLILCVGRESAIGKRDYLILLLAAEYGWRSSDICKFKYDYIDWDNNVIQFEQQKTGNPVSYPLLASVGNAIIDYLKYGRPISDCEYIIVSHQHCEKGYPLSAPTIHSIVTKYMRLANISNWETKKHGPHSLRHSLATNMLKKEIPLPVIKTVLGHQSTESTNVYLNVDIEKLRKCALTLPEMKSSHYKEALI